MSYKSHRTGPSRVFDHLYDPIYATSGFRNICQNNQNALVQSAPIHIQSNFDTMFTDLPRYSRMSYFMQHNPLPHWPYNGNNDQKITRPSVGGQDRVKFFNLPLTNTRTVNVHLDEPKKYCSCVENSDHKLEPFRSVGCQTKYREQSAQTKPWMPDAVISDKCGEIPEIIYIADLIKGDEIPGIFEAQIVERFRMKAEWKKSCAQFGDCKEFSPKQRKALEAFEWIEWLAREEEIEYCQRKRLQIVEKMMESRKSRHQLSSAKKIQNTKNRILERRDERMRILKNDYQRSLRRLKNKYYKQPKNVIVDEESDPASNLYGPQMRYGLQPKHRHFIPFGTTYEARLDGLHRMQIEPMNYARFEEQKIDLTKPKGRIYEIEQGFWSDKYLQYLYESLKTLRFQKKARPDRPNCLKPIEKKPITASPHESIDCMIDETNNVNTLQEMLEEKDDHIVNASIYTELMAFVHRKNDILGEAHQDDINVQEEIDKIKSTLNDEQCLQIREGKSLGFLLNYFDRELLRLVDEKKAHALHMLTVNQLKESSLNEIEQNQSNAAFISEYLENVLADNFDHMENDCMIREIIDDLVNKMFENELAENIVSNVLQNNILANIDYDEPIDTNDCVRIAAKDVASWAIEESIKLAIPDDPIDQIICEILNDIINEIISNPITENDLANM